MIWHHTTSLSRISEGSADKIPLMIEIQGKSMWIQISLRVSPKLIGIRGTDRGFGSVICWHEQWKSWHWKHKAWHVWRQIRHATWHISSWKRFYSVFCMGWVDACIFLQEQQFPRKQEIYMYTFSWDLLEWKQGWKGKWENANKKVHWTIYTKWSFLMKLGVDSRCSRKCKSKFFNF